MINQMRRVISLGLLIALGGAGTIAQAQYRQPYRVTDRQVSQLLSRIETRANAFRDSLDVSLDRSRIDGTGTEDDINRYVRDFEDATNRLRDRFNRRQSAAADVEEVLNRAASIDGFVTSNRLGGRAERDWRFLRTDLNTLADYYNVTWNWNNSNFPPANQGVGVGVGTNRITGTYRLDPSRSDDARDAAERATNSLPYGDRQRVLDAVTARLESPDTLAIERRGRTVTIASSRSPQFTFEADGRESIETGPNGATIRARATLSGDQLTVSSTGSRGNDFNVTFNPVENGRRLIVTRRVTVDRLNRPVVVQSMYDKTSDVAQFSIGGGSGSGTSYPTDTAGGDFIIPNGTQLVAVLNNNLTTRESRENDRFTMTVRDRSRYDGAVIEGYVSNLDRSGRIAGRAQMTLNFERIRLRDGRSYRFSGLVESVRTADGETVRVDNEGSVREGDSQTDKTVQRTAIGSAVGAIIGAIAGGGKGAAIGAIVGAGGGAGSVYVQGRDDLELLSGTEVTIRASSPRN